MNKGQLLKQIILNGVDATGYESAEPLTILEKAAFLRSTYMSEHGNWANDHYGSQVKAIEEYLRGLPSCCSFPFYNAHILEVFEKYGFKANTERQETDLVEQYWRGMALHFDALIEGRALPKKQIEINLDWGE
jgi:hypothetical protein